MSARERLDEIEYRLASPMVTCKENATEDAPALVAALRAVLDVADEGLANETRIGFGGATWPLVDARDVRDAIADALDGAP